MDSEKIDISTPSLETLKQDLNQVIFEFRDAISQSEKLDEQFTVLDQSFDKILNTAIQLTDAAHQNPEDIKPYWYFTYIFPENIKDFLLLIRDAMLENLKSTTVAYEDKTDSNSVQEFMGETKKVVEESVQQFATQINTSTYPSEINKIKKAVRFQDCPLGIYKEQFEQIGIQKNNIKKYYDDTLVYAEQFANIRLLIKDHLEQTLKRTKEQHAKTVSLQESLHSEEKNPNWEKLMDVDDIPTMQEAFKDQLHTYVDKLANFKCPVYAEDGMIYLRELNLRKNTQRWIEYYLFPDLLDLWQSEELLTQEYSLTLGNVKNTLQLQAKNEESASLLGDAPLERLVQAIDENETFQVKVSRNISSLINKYLYLSNFFDSSANVEIAAQTLRIDSSIKSYWIKTWTKLQTFFSKTYLEAKGENQLNIEEKAIRCIADRMTKEDNNHYDTLFLNKNFIGDLLLVKREEEERKFGEAHDLWQKGFEIATLIVGNRLSGISTFMEQVNQHFFEGSAVFIEPNSSFRLNGRKIEGCYSLKRALSNFKKHHIPDDRYGIFIDDLHKWHSKEFSLLENVQALIEFIQQKPTECFLVVSCNQYLSNFLDQRYAFKNAFNAHLNLEQSKKVEIRRAIIMRHGASHRPLMNQKREQIKEKDLEAYIDKVSQRYNYNLGAILQAWTFQTTEGKDREITFLDTFINFKPFFDDAAYIILKKAALYGSVQEYELKKDIPVGFNDKFNRALNKLIHAKVLVRSRSGKLYINSVILFEVEQFLHNRNQLQ